LLMTRVKILEIQSLTGSCDHIFSSETRGGICVACMTSTVDFCT
jgi:hypothetical protein